MDELKKNISDSAIDLSLFSDGKRRFEKLYAKTPEERHALRSHEAYRQALLDIWEMAVTARGIANTDDAFLQLFGKAVFFLAADRTKMTGNITD